MKTHEISLKKKILLVELPEGYEVDKVIKVDNVKSALPFDIGITVPKGIDFLGKLSDLQDSDVEGLIEKVMQGQHYQNYKARKENDAANLWCKSALESFMSAIEAEVYWENPYADNPDSIRGLKAKYREAESRTFDKSRTLIFVEK